MMFNLLFPSHIPHVGMPPQRVWICLMPWNQTGQWVLIRLVNLMQVIIIDEILKFFSRNSSGNSCTLQPLYICGVLFSGLLYLWCFWLVEVILPSLLIDFFLHPLTLTISGMRLSYRFRRVDLLPKREVRDK